MLPLPNCFSIVETARSIAFSRTGSRVGFGFLSSFSTLVSGFSLFSVVVVAMSCLRCGSCQLEFSAARDRKTYVEPSPPRRLS